MNRNRSLKCHSIGRRVFILIFSTLASSLSPATAAPVKQAYLTASNPDRGDFFGGSVAVSGDTMVVGAHGEASDATGVNGSQNNNNAYNSGAAYVFVRIGTNWVQQAYLKASNTGGADDFGRAVAISGDTVVVGADGEGSSATGVNGDQNDNSAYQSGAAYVFVRRGTTWTQQAYIKASNTRPYALFGLSVAVSGDTAVIGSGGESSNARGVNGDQANDSAPYAGAAYIFVRSGTNWSQQAYLKASNTETNDYFGSSVALSGDTAVLGAPSESSNARGVNGNQNNNSAPRAGAAYVFVRNGTNWSQQAYLKASNTEVPDQFGNNDGFGLSVSISGGSVVVGARDEDSNAIGVNGNQVNNSATDSGAAYVFVRTGTNWSQQAYLKASNTGMFDSFGGSVSVSGDILVVGADYEASNAWGVNGDQTDNRLPGAGAAYVFKRRGTTWVQQAYLKAADTPPAPRFGAAVAVSGDDVAVGAWNHGTSEYMGAAYLFTGFALHPRVALVPDGGGGYFLRFNGTPNDAYRVQRAAAVAGPWATVTTLTAPATGLVEYHDASPPLDQAFYRVVSP